MVCCRMILCRTTNSEPVTSSHESPRTSTTRLWLVLALGLVLVFGQAARASNDIEQQLRQQDKQVQQIREALNKQRQQLEQTEQTLAKLHQEIQKLESVGAELASQRERLIEERRAIESRLETLTEEIIQALNIAYRIGDQALLQTLLDNSDALQSERQMRYLQALISPATEQLKSWQLAQESLRQIEHQLQERAQELEENRLSLERNQSELRKQQLRQQQQLAGLDQQLKSEQARLIDLQERQKRIQAEIARIEAEERRKAEEARAQQEQSQKATAKPPAALSADRVVFSNPADFPDDGAIPVAGRITRPYGAALGIGNLKSDGITFATNQGSPVRAVANGQVAFANWMSGFGQIVILKHEDGYISLYAHNASLTVREGDRVRKGQVLGTAGRTGGRAEPGLYFEVRKGETPVNPTSWAPYNQASRGG